MLVLIREKDYLPRWLCGHAWARKYLDMINQ